MSDYPSMSHVQHITFEGNDCVVMSPEEYGAALADLEAKDYELSALRAELTEARRERDEFCAIVADRTEEISSLEFQLTQATAAAAVPDDVAKDAARYRWLRDGDNGGVLSVGALTGVSDMGWELVTWIYDEALDAAIDAAILSAKEKGQ